MAVKMGFKSDVELRRGPYSPLPSPDSQTNDMNGFEDDDTTGFDYDFVPPLDNKYMCPICLLALRDPVQTGCGHRFCHLCILRCIRNQARCPVDQTPLSSKQLFIDRSAQREVMDLKVKCSNVGCKFVSELRNIQKHIVTCPVRQVACQHKCGMFFSPLDVVVHEDNHCLLRPVTCPICGQNYPFNAKKEHEEDCKQHQPVDCPHCSRKVKRYRHSRHEIQKHMEMSTQIHLQYLLSTVISLQKQNIALEESLKDANAKLKDVEVHHKYPHDMSKNGLSVRHHSTNGYQDDAGTTMKNLKLYDSDSSDTRYDANSSPAINGEVDEIALIKAYNRHMGESDGAGMSSSSSAASSPSVLPNGTFDGLCSTSGGVKVLQSKFKDHDQKIVSLDHHVRELVAKMENQLVQMKEINDKLSTVKQRVEEGDLRCCNGLYHWRIHDYSQLRKAATQGDLTVLHSPGFYTSPQGYRMCIRANLDGVENAQGTHLSLFVHIMKGDYDDLLHWPFQGSITLTIINQRELPSQRSHISETLEAQTNLMAFRKPNAERNQKGYGYIDFFPLKMIETGGFIKANTLIIKAQVKVYDVVPK